MLISRCSLILYLASFNPGVANILTVQPNDFDDLEAKIGQAADQDTILVPPGNYIGKENGQWPVDSNYNNNPKNICDMVSSVGGIKPNIIIKGTGSSPSKVKLVGITLQYCRFFLVVENLSMSFCDSFRSIVEQDNDRGLILRNVIITTPYTSRYGIHMMSSRIGIIDSHIKTSPAIPGIGATGVSSEGHVTMLNSEVKGYTYGIVLRGLSSDPDMWKIYGNKLNKNTKNCSTSTSSFVSCNPSLSNIAPNTPKGNSPYILGALIDILHFSNNQSSGPYIPVAVTFPKVLKAGETTCYRLPSAYPQDTISNWPPFRPHYFQFDSTAKLGKKAVLEFDKVAIDSEFPANSNIQVYTFMSGGWVLVPHVIQGAGYTFSFPTKKMSGLIAFFAV